MSNEVLDLLACGFAQSFGSTEVYGVSFDEVGIELMVAYRLAKAIADLGPAMVSISSLQRDRAHLTLRSRRLAGRTDLFYRANADAVRLSQCAVDRPGRGN